jgi:DNA-binding IclR family transcriptional regulator
MPERLLTVTKVLRITQLLVRGGPLSLAEISLSLGLSKTVVHRALATLRDESWVEQDDETRRYRLGLGLWETGMGALQHFPAYAVAQPHLERLARTVRDTAGLAVYDDGQMLFITRVTVVDEVAVSVPIAGRALPHTTSGGKVALAYLSEARARLDENPLPGPTEFTVTDQRELDEEIEEVRRRGYAVNDRGRARESCGVAAPVFDHAGRYLASIYVACPATSFSAKWVARVAPAVVGCAADVSLALGYRAPWHHAAALG